MKETLQKQMKELEKLKKYYKLIKADENSYKNSVEVLGNDLPEELSSWLKIYNGGTLFGISMLSTKNKVDGKFNKLLTFDEVNSKEMQDSIGIPVELKIFAQTSYGNYYCFITDENTQNIYEYDIEEKALTVKWESFTDWLGEIIENAKNDIKEGFLEELVD